MIQFMQSINCPRVRESGAIKCMVCGEGNACGHVEVLGGPFAGRIILLTCFDCGQPDREKYLYDALSQQVLDGYLDMITGGPGFCGAPWISHDGHLEPLEDWGAEHGR